MGESSRIFTGSSASADRMERIDGTDIFHMSYTWSNLLIVTVFPPCLASEFDSSQWHIAERGR